MEAKVDELVKRVDPEGGEAVIKELDAAYAGRHTDAAKRQKAERRR